MATTALDFSKFQVPSSDSVAAQIQNAVSQVSDIAAQNSARSEAYAREQRSWQERQNALAMQFNAAEAAKNRDWQQMMSNTAHQREVADLRAAGLNPVLSAGGGNGAAVTSGATASGVTSAGAKGDVDTSASQAFVTLLGSLLQAQTTMQEKTMSALTSMAIADKQAATSELVAQIAGMYGLAGAQTSAAAQERIQSSKEAHDLLIHKAYPSNPIQAISSGIGLLTEGEGLAGLQNLVKKGNSENQKMLERQAGVFRNSGSQFGKGSTRGSGSGRR